MGTTDAPIADAEMPDREEVDTAVPDEADTAVPNPVEMSDV